VPDINSLLVTIRALVSIVVKAHALIIGAYGAIDPRSAAIQSTLRIQHGLLL
jgi:hypothetical protein